MSGLRKLSDAELSDHGLSLGPLETTAGLMLRIAQLSSFDNFFALYKEGEVKISEHTVLVAIAQNPGVRQGAVADVLKIKWSNMTKLVRTLEERGLITRHVPRNDRRSVLLTVTEEGRRQIDALGNKIYRLDRQSLSMLDDNEHAQLLALTRKIAGWPEKSES